MAYAGFGLLASDKAEKVFGYEASEEDRERLRGMVPRVQMVERDADLGEVGEGRGK